MEEKVLATSVPCDLKKVFKRITWILIAICVVLIICMAIAVFAKGYSWASELVDQHTAGDHNGTCGYYECGKWEHSHSYSCYSYGCDREVHKHSDNCPRGICYYMDDYPVFSHGIDWMFDHFKGISLFFIWVGAVLIGVLWLVYAALPGYEMTITDRRVYGKLKFGKRVDLPLDSVTAVAIKGKRKLAVSTASGVISFGLLKNRDELYQCITELLMKRQEQVAKNSAPTVQPSTASVAQQLREFKELLDAGVISQEEFDAKKKQLLNI